MRRRLELSRESALEIEDLPPEIEARAAGGATASPRRAAAPCRSRPSTARIAVELIVHGGSASPSSRDQGRPPQPCVAIEIASMEKRAPSSLSAPMRKAQAPSVSSREIGPCRVRRERRVRRGALGENRAAAIEHDELDVGLADVEDRDAAGSSSAHSPDGTLSTSGAVTGLPSGLAAMMSFMCSHQRRMTGWPAGRPCDDRRRARDRRKGRSCRDRERSNSCDAGFLRARLELRPDRVVAASVLVRLAGIEEHLERVALHPAARLQLYRQGDSRPAPARRAGKRPRFRSRTC